MLYAGLRLEEAAALLWADVDLVNETVLVRDGKGGKARAVPLHPALKRELKKTLLRQPQHAVCGNPDGRQMRGKALAHLFERWLPRLGVAGVSAHRLRHTFATRLLKAGVDVCDIQVAMGHTRLDTTSIYLCIDAERIRTQVGKLPDWEAGV
jgi:integrase/recombinase XerD